MVDSEQYLLTLVHYIEMNPVRASMAVHSWDYSWSSYGFNALREIGKNADWLTPHLEYQRLERDAAERRSAYRQSLHVAVSNADLTVIRASTHKGWALGSDRFKAQVERLTQRRTTSKEVGWLWLEG